MKINKANSKASSLKTSNWLLYLVAAAILALILAAWLNSVDVDDAARRSAWEVSPSDPGAPQPQAPAESPPAPSPASAGTAAPVFRSAGEDTASTNLAAAPAPATSSAAPAPTPLPAPAEPEPCLGKGCGLEPVDALDYDPGSYNGVIGVETIPYVPPDPPAQPTPPENEPY